MTLKATSDTGSGLDGQYVPSPSERVRTQVTDYEASGGVEGPTLEGRVHGNQHVAVASARGLVAERSSPHLPEYRRLAGRRDIPIMVVEPMAPTQAGTALGEQTRSGCRP